MTTWPVVAPQMTPSHAQQSWPTQEDSRLWVSWMPALKSNSASLSMLKHPLVTVARWRRRAKRHNDNDDKKRKGKPMARSLISLPT